MYLQSLEILGFKSFATKTLLNFHRGVTAIVGPNGCGKSNVLDAIRWVLGEQSAKALRGGEMADVIFSGTDSKQALGMAEVSITFTDCEKELGMDWNEVRITRRVFRDGNSEYFLNKTPCRLRDIHQLFMDTGIGRSAYSIMEQGKIDQILSSKPDDRRTIFEEAAGITKFKSQKKEALRKLEHTEANLIRVTDIIKEVKRQIGSLQRQAAKARRYQSLITDLKILETHSNHRQYDLLASSMNETVEAIEKYRVAQQSQEQEIEQQESEISTQRGVLGEMEQNLQQARQVVQDLRTQINNGENRLHFNQERITEFNSLVERYQLDIAASEEKLSIQETQIQNTDQELLEISNLLEFEQSRLGEKQDNTTSLTSQRVDAERSLQETSNSIGRLENRLSGLRGEVSSIIQRRDGSETRLKILTDDLVHIVALGENLNQQLTETSDQFEETKRSLEASQNQVEQSEAAVRDIQGSLEQTDQQLTTEQRRLAERESKLEVLQQLNEEGEGFSQGTQAVLRGLDNPDFFKPSIAGALTAHLEVDPQYVIAIEAALGQHLQAIVLKDTMVAQSVITTLTNQKLGRASLILRDLLPSSAEFVFEALPEGAISWAKDQAKVPSELQPLIFTLLNGVVLVQDLETALRLKPATPNLAYVTLNGETVSREGILNGGQNGENGSSVLQRKNQITQLQDEAEKIRATVRELSAHRDSVFEQLEVAQARLRETREETQNINLKVSTLQGQISLLERETRDSNHKMESLRWEQESIEAQRNEAIASIENLEISSEQIRSESAGLQAKQIELQQTVENLRAAETEAAQELNEIRIKVATERQRHTSLNNQRQPMAARLAELREIIEHRRGDIENYKTKSANLSEDSIRIQGEIEATRGQIAEAEQSVSQLNAERSGVLENIESLESTMRILRRQLSECHDLRSQHEVKQTQIQLRMENLSEHVTRRYQIDIREFRPDRYALLCSIRDQEKRRSRGSQSILESQATEGESEALSAAASNEEPGAASPTEEVEASEIDWDFVESIVRELDQKIDTMGPINIDAIQEYEELEQRHQFLENQFNDLTNSKTELLDVISKINTTTRKMFAETFEKIRVNFAEMFTELFGGGKANLVLLDESDPLESGIDIIAKPPGKQLQSISLLSGGEKTMTAVALLFSIYMVKPSPFCVLDEMDAPLDESNINRFIKILDRFVNQSQFVVITHNKRTIAKADVLYGVTMEEHGVSKLVGVKFSKREDSNQGADIIGTANLAPIPSVAESFGKSGDLHSEVAAG